MIRRLLSVLAAVALVVTAGSATAGIFDPANSKISVQIGSIPSTFGIPATGGAVVLTNDGMGGHKITDVAGVWQTTDFSAGTAFYTGIPLISDVRITVSNKSGDMHDNWGPVTNPLDGGSTCDPNDINAQCFGGYEPLQGQAVIHALGLQIPVSLDPVGWIAGGTATASVLNNAVTITAMSFVTGTVRMTGISTNLVTLPDRANAPGAIFTLNPTAIEHGNAVNQTTLGGDTQTNPGGVIQELQTVTVNGTNSLISAGSSQHPGMVTLISPIRVNTHGLVGRIPAMAKKKFVFVPEPGTMLLLVSGAVGLAVVGRKRMRK